MNSKKNIKKGKMNKFKELNNILYEKVKEILKIYF